MSILRDTFWMAGSTALRLTSGMLLFVVLARLLGVDAFGRLMMSFAAGALLALPTHFGLSLLLLREVPLANDRGAALLANSLALKGALMAVTIAGLAGVSLFTSIEVRLLWPLVTMHMVESFTELLCATLRASGAYRAETRFVTRQALAQFAIVGATAWRFPDPFVVAWALAASRCVSLAFACFTVSLHMRASLPRPCLRDTIALVRRALAYFVDMGVQSSLVQVDVVLLGHFAGAAAVGFYQAAMRVAHGISQAITILVNVILPRLSIRIAKQGLDRRLAARVAAVFASAGIIVAGPLYFGADAVAHLLYGQAFAGLGAVFEVVAVFLLIRFSGAAAGVLLIASGEQGKRAAVMIAGVVILAAASSLLMPRFGAVGAALAMSATYAFIAGALFVLVFFRLQACKRREERSLREMSSETVDQESAPGKGL